MADSMTRRDAIQKFRGDFYKLLLDAYDALDEGPAPSQYVALCHAYRAADPDHREVLRLAFPMIEALCHWMLDICHADVTNGLTAIFPGLVALDEEESDPTDFDLLVDPWAEVE